MDFNALLSGIVDTAIYSLVGIVMMVIGFGVICLITPFSIKKEIEDDQNIALGIIIGSVIIGIAVIIGSVISSPSAAYTSKSAAKPAVAEVQSGSK